MTKEEVLNEITKRPKYYAGIMEQAAAAMTVRRIKQGTCKPSSEAKFFAAFGFVVDTPALYARVPEKWFEDFKFISRMEQVSIVNNFDDYKHLFDEGLSPECAVQKLHHLSFKS